MGLGGASPDSQRPRKGPDSHRRSFRTGTPVTALLRSRESTGICTFVRLLVSRPNLSLVCPFACLSDISCATYLSVRFFFGQIVLFSLRLCCWFVCPTNYLQQGDYYFVNSFQAVRFHNPFVFVYVQLLFEPTEVFLLGTFDCRGHKTHFACPGGKVRSQGVRPSSNGFYPST